MAAKEKTKPGNNSYDPEKVKPFMTAYEAEDAKIATIMSNAMTACKVPRKKQREILDEVKADGTPKGLFKTAAQMRKLERKKDAARNKLEPEDQDELDLLRQALGDLEDTPLGEAAQKAM